VPRRSWCPLDSYSRCTRRRRIRPRRGQSSVASCRASASAAVSRPGTSDGCCGLPARLRTDRATGPGSPVVLVTAASPASRRGSSSRRGCRLRGDLARVPTSSSALLAREEPAVGGPRRCRGDRASHESASSDAVRGMVSDRNLASKGRVDDHGRRRDPRHDALPIPAGAWTAWFRCGGRPTRHDAAGPRDSPAPRAGAILRFEGASRRWRPRSSASRSAMSAAEHRSVDGSAAGVRRPGATPGDGLFTITDLSDPFWFDDATAATPITRDISSTSPTSTTVALLARSVRRVHDRPGVTGPDALHLAPHGGRRPARRATSTRSSPTPPVCSTFPTVVRSTAAFAESDLCVGSSCSRKRWRVRRWRS
jgi:hypothetical protein